MYCEVYSIAEIRRKIAAFRELYQVEPKVFLAGTWIDAGNDAVFFETHKSKQVSAVNRAHLICEVDGENCEIKPTPHSGIYLAKP